VFHPLFLFERTGLYREQLTMFLSNKSLCFKGFSGLKIKRSLGIVSGKNDCVDAKQIALYAYRLKDEIEANQPINSQIKKLKPMAFLRAKLVWS
jgi:hypothetical protein